MKKSTKKIVKRLERYVGQKIIRTGGTHHIGDFSYTENPLILKGFTLKGEMIVEYPKENVSFAGNKKTLPIYFTDDLWISYRKALRPASNKLNQWKGKKVRRTCCTKRIGDGSFMCKSDLEVPPTLVSASKHHVVIECNDCGFEGKRVILNCDFADPSEWELAE